MKEYKTIVQYPGVDSLQELTVEELTKIREDIILYEECIKYIIRQKLT